MLRFFTTDIRRNIVKIICLTLGMAFGLILTAKVYFELSYDTFFTDSDNLYLITERASPNGEYREGEYIPGAIAPGMKRYIPYVVASTRFTPMTGEAAIKLRDGRRFNTRGLFLADSCHFDVLDRDIISGDPHEVLAVDNSCMIPRSLADKIGGDVIGLEISCPTLSEDYWATVGGIYEDYPDNSTIPNAVYLSLQTIRFFMGDGRENWEGNDRYVGHLRLTPGTNPEEIQPYIDRMVEENVSEEAREVVKLTFNIKPLKDSHLDNGGIRSMMWILSLLGVTMLMGAALNYLLIVIGQMPRRAKEMAVRKCYGTSNRRIFATVIGESLFFIVVSGILAMLLVFCFSDECRRILGYTPRVLFSTGGVWAVETAVCLVLVIVAGVIPAWMYCRTPVAHVFNRSPKNRKIWKLALLSFQFFTAGLLLCLLTLIGRQYFHMTSIDLGYNPDNVGIASLSGIPQQSRGKVVEELKRLSCVRTVSSADQNFVDRCSGNNVWVDGMEDKAFNVADMYYAGPDIADVLGFKIIEGEMFDSSVDSTSRKVVVEQRLAEAFKKYFNIEGSLVGRTFHITEHGYLDGDDEKTICGVIADMRRGGFTGAETDQRPGILFPSGPDKVCENLYVRFHKLTPQTLSEAQKVISEVLPTYDIVIFPYRIHVDYLYQPVRQFGTSVMIAGLATILIALIGLMGYTADEVQRRAREIAIRKVNGTSVTSILRLFCKDIVRVAVPSLLTGGAAALYIGREWLANFTDRTTLSPLSMTVSLSVILAILLAVIIAGSLRIARSNPVDYLRAD